jgi:cytochrome c-type biogenesis protein CcmH/NrfF
MTPLAAVPSGTQAQAYEYAAKALLCDCGCNPQSIKDCACSRADELRASLAADAAAGKTADQIIAAYVAKNGVKILVSPPATGFNLIAWIGPAAGLLVATALIVTMIRRWRTAAAGAAPPVAATLDPADLARLKRDLDDLR